MQVGDSHDRMLLVSEYTVQKVMYSVYTLYQRGRNVAWIFTETKDLHVSNNRAAYDFSSNVSLTHAFIFDY